MSGIKLPVWVEECDDYYSLRDAEGNECMLHSVIAALNAAPQWQPLSLGAEYPETFLLCRKDGSSGAVPGRYDKRNPHFYVFDSDGSSWIENANDWLWMPPPAAPNGPEGGAA